MIKIIAIARNTFIQNIRQPVFFLVSVMIIPAVVVCVPLCICRSMNIQYREADQLMFTNLALSSIQIASYLLAVICAAATIDREIRNRTALAVIAKPTARWQFVLGKYLGVTAAVSLGFYIGVPTLLLAARHQVPSTASMPLDAPVIVIGLLAVIVALAAAGFGNCFFKWHFIGAAVVSLAVLLTAAFVAVCFIGPDWGAADIADTFGEGRVHYRHLTGTVMIYLSVLLLSAFAVAASTRLGPLPAMLASGAFLVTGALHEWLIGSLEDMFGSGTVAAIADTLLPNLNLFEPYDAIAKGWDIPAAAIGYTALYTLFYTAALIVVAVILFNRRELSDATTASRPPRPVALAVGLLRVSAAGLLLTVVAAPQSGEHAMGWPARVAVAGVAVAILAMSLYLEKKRTWARWATIIAVVAVLARNAAVTAFPSPVGFLQPPGFGATATAVSTVVCIAVAALLVTGKARRFFRRAKPALPGT